MPNSTKSKPLSYRMIIPKEDEATTAWLAAQYNGSFSLRKLIHQDIASNGISDVTSRFPEVKDG